MTDRTHWSHDPEAYAFARLVGCFHDTLGQACLALLALTVLALIGFGGLA